MATTIVKAQRICNYAEGNGGLQEIPNLKLVGTKIFNSGCVALHY